MKILDQFQQHSLAWLEARAGIPTASEFNDFMTLDFEIRKGDTLKTYIARKCAERWIGGPLPGFSSISTEFGEILENEALPWFELETGKSVQRVGLCLTDDGLAGCSPDALLGENSGLEVKCPMPVAHTRYLLEGKLPPDYRAQVHGSLYVTGRPEWMFLSYRRSFPKLLLTIKRDEEIQNKIADCLCYVVARIEESFQVLLEANGGVCPAQNRQNNLETLLKRSVEQETERNDVPH